MSNVFDWIYLLYTLTQQPNIHVFMKTVVNNSNDLLLFGDSTIYSMS